MLTSFKHSSARNLRCFATFVDPFGAKGQGDVNEGELYEHNALVGYTKMIGDPKKGLADDTSVHPFGDLRINLARFNPCNLCFWWEYDFTGGRILNNGQNALLSNKVKNEMFALHTSDPKEWTVERLAERYRVRQQRVMAILSLKERALGEMSIPDAKRKAYRGMTPPQLSMDPNQNAEDEEDDDPQLVDETETQKTQKKKSQKQIKDEEWYNLCDWAEEYVFGAMAEVGSGERHFVSVPTFPKFEEIPLSEAHKYTNTEWSISRVNRMYTAKEDRFQIREFKERLLMNTGKLGATLDFKTDRTRMHRSPPKHDTPIVITSLDKDMVAPYVAQPDGTRRRLTPDEFLMWKRTNREAFTKLVEKQIEREGKKDQTRVTIDN